MLTSNKLTVSSVPDSFNPFTGTIVPTQTEYTVNLEQVGTIIFESALIDVSNTELFLNFRNETNSTVANTSFTVLSAEGALTLFNYTFTTNGTTFSESSVVPTGGVITTTNFPIDTGERTVDITYTILKSDGSNIRFVKSYKLFEVEPLTLSSQMFVGVNDPAVRVLAAYIITTMLSLGVLAATTSIIGGVLMFSATLGFFSIPSINWVPGSVAVLSIVIIVGLVLANERVQ